MANESASVGFERTLPGRVDGGCGRAVLAHGLRAPSPDSSEPRRRRGAALTRRYSDARACTMQMLTFNMHCGKVSVVCLNLEWCRIRWKTYEMSSAHDVDSHLSADASHLLRQVMTYHWKQSVVSRAGLLHCGTLPDDKTQHSNCHVTRKSI